MVGLFDEFFLYPKVITALITIISISIQHSYFPWTTYLMVFRQNAKDVYIAYCYEDGVRLSVTTAK